MGFVEHAVRESAEPIGADGLDLGRALDAVGGGAVSGDIEGLIGILGPVEIVGAEDLIFRVQVIVDAAKNRGIANGVLDRQAFVLTETALKEIEQCEALAIGAGGYLRIGDRSTWTENGAGDTASCTERGAEVFAGEVFANAFAGGEEEEFVLDDGAAEAAAELVAAETVEGLAVGSGGGQSLSTEIFKGAAVKIVGAGLGDDVNDSARGAAKFRIGTTGDDLELLYGFEGDVDRGALAAHLLAEEAVVVVSAIKADVVEDTALAVDVDFVAVGTLADADARS